MTAELPNKPYFRIGEVAGIVGVEPHVLRYWEREFRSNIRPGKSARGQRVYSRRDVENLLRVRELLYTQGFTIAGARKQLLQRSTPLPTPVPEALKGDADAGSGAPPPPPTDPNPQEPPEPADASLRETLTAVRDEVSAFLDELGG